MATDDLVEVAGTTLTLEANGGATTAGSFTQANDDTVATADDAGFPFMRLVLECTFGTAPTAGTPINIHKRALNIIDTTDDETTPASGVYGSRIYSFHVANTTSAQRWVSDPVPRNSTHELELYIENGTNQTISAGWKLTATPITYGPSA